MSRRFCVAWMRGCVWFEGKYLHTGELVCALLSMQARIEGDEMSSALGTFAKRAESGLKGVEGCSGGELSMKYSTGTVEERTASQIPNRPACGNEREEPRE